MKSPHTRMFLFLFTLLLNVNAWAQHYTARPLNGGRQISVNGINDSGMSVGAAGISPRSALFWQANTSTPVDLGNLGGHYAEAFAINNLGQVVGYSELSDKSTHHAFLWSSDTGMHDLGALGGGSQANAINDHTEVVGGLFGNTLHAFLWTQAGGMQDLGTLGGSFSTANGISAAGHVVGTATRSGENVGRAFIWTAQDGMKELDLGQASASQAWAINDSDQVVGTFTNPQDNSFHAFLWSPIAGMKDLGMLTGNVASTAYAINNSGDVVGISYALKKGSLKGFSVIWRHGGAAQKLGLLVVPKIGLPRGATGINKSGQITANGPGSWLLTPQ
jgi:probable HAF family extracellular repeat protein